MAGRQNKVGLDYFELDCHMDEKVRLIQAEYGLKGFAVFVKLLQEIYGGNGYYCEWTRDRELLFASENGLSNGSIQLLKDIVSACVRRNIFSERLFKEYGILTSSGIQKQYLKATVKREVIDLKKEYLLITIPENRTNVAINIISVGKNAINDGRNAQRKEEKSKEENKYILCKSEAEELFETLWEMYPNKKGKAQVTEEDKRKLLEIGLEEMTRAIQRYKKYIEVNQDWYKTLNGSTFFKGRYHDYIGDDYEEQKQPVKKSGFNSFQQNDYDFDRLEKELLSN